VKCVSSGYVYYYYYYLLIYLFLTAVGLTPGGSSTVHIYTPNSTQNIENGTYITIQRKNRKRKNLGSAACAPSFASDTLAFALKLRKKHGKPSG
jgi:hypothetical protein